MHLPTRGFVAGLVFALSLSMPAFADGMISVDHAQGTTEVPINPAKVIVYDLASLDTLNALGVDVYGVPAFSMPENLKKFEEDAYVKMGSLFEPDYEAVNAAKPDLIIVAGRSSAALPELSKIAPTIDLSNDWATFVPSVKANSEILGQIFSKSDEVGELIDELDAAIASVNERATAIGSVFVVLTNGGKVTAYGPGSRFGFVHDTLGLIPAIEDVEAATHGEAISNELILDTNPDWMVVLDRDAALGRGSGDAAKQVLDNELVGKTMAWQKEQVVYVNSARWYITNGGVANMIEIVAELSSKMGLDG